jgi:hypothetical protein
MAQQGACLDATLEINRRCAFHNKTALYIFTEKEQSMHFDTVTVVAIIVIVIGAGYFVLKRRSRT